MEERFISLLALERCEIYVAHICALIHAGSEEGENAQAYKSNARDILHIVQNISRDISLLKDTME